MIRSSKHSLKFTNKSKVENVHLFIKAYRNVLHDIVLHLWNNGIQDKLDISKNKLDCPRMLSSNYLKQFDSRGFNARMMQCIGKQACSMIKAAIKKRSKQLYKLKELQQNNKDTKRLQRRIDIQPLVIPTIYNANPELDSRFVDFEFCENKEFNMFIKMYGFGLDEMNVKIPIKYTRTSNKWMNKGSLKNSVRISKNNVYLMFNIEDIPKKRAGITVGCDQGIVNVATFSDGQMTMPCIHGHNLQTIQRKLSRRVSDSKGFKRAQEHRKNYIYWCLNQLNFSDVRELRLEKLFQVRYKSKTSKFLKHFTYALIKNKFVSLSEEKGFQLKEIPNEFRSQRCSQCGWVRKSNRKGKTFKCKNCSFVCDSDLNAASNLEIDLFEIPYWVRLKKVNLKGFFWTPEGLFSDCHESTVRDTQEPNNVE